jgi:hypothetical protein
MFFPILCFSNDYEIAEIRPLFNESTPGFGKFKIQVEIKSHVGKESTFPVVCIYSGLTKPGVYFKNQPRITRVYQQVTLCAYEEKKVIFEQDFVAYHPETLGEILVSIVGKGVVRSFPVQTRFHPGSEQSRISDFSPPPDHPDRKTRAPDPSGWKESRLFHYRFQDKFARRIIVSKCGFPAALLTPVHSKNRAYYCMTGSPDFSRKGPWSTIIYIYAEKEELTRVKLADHAAYPVQIKWINEKLIFIRVWWGRRIGTDLIFDAESGSIITKEMVEDGSILYKQYQESKEEQIE